MDEVAFSHRGMDSDALLDHAIFQLSPRRSRCELFVSGNGKTEKIASGFLKPFVTHLKVVAEQAARAVTSIKLEVESRRTNGETWFKKGTLERFLRFVSTPEVLELVNTFDVEMSQLEGAKIIYLQGAGDPLSGSLGVNQITAEAAVDMTKKELFKAIDVRLVAVKQDLTTACAQASFAGFTPDNVSELLHFAEYFGANRLNEACTKFISLCQRHPELISLHHPPQSQSLPLKSIDDGHVHSSSSSEMSIDELEVKPNVAGKPPTGGGLHLHMPSDNKPAWENASELLGTYQQLKPIQWHFLDRTVGKLEDHPTPAALGSESAEQDGGHFRHFSVQDRINLFESKKKEQSVSSKNVSSNVIVNRVAAGKGDHRWIPSDVSDKSVLRRWSGASAMSIDLSSSGNSSINDRKDSGSTSGTCTSANLLLQSISRSEERVASASKDVAMLQSLLGPKECIAVAPSSSLSSGAQFKAVSNDRDHTEEEGNKTSIAQFKQTLHNEEGKHQMSAFLDGMKFYESSDQDASWTEQKDFLKFGDHSPGSHPQSKVTSEHYAQVKDHAALQVMSQAVSAAAEQDVLKDQGSFRSRTRKIPSQPDGAGVKYQPKLCTRKTDDTQVKAKGPSDFQIKPSGSSTIYLEPHPRGTTLPRTIMGAGGRETAATEQVFGPIPVNKKGEDSGHLGINLHEQSSVHDYIRKFQGERAHSERKKLPVFPVRSAKESMELLDPLFASSVEQAQMARLLKGGNQELNEGLQMKANELEKLFAAHKLRIQKDKAATFQRSKPADIHKDHVLKPLEKGHAMALPDQLPERKLVMDTSMSEVLFDANLLSNMVDSKEYESNLIQKFDNMSDDLKGKFYDKYKQKRNAKLLEEWESKRTQKEAKMKAMRDRLECSLTEMRAKFVLSADGQSSNHARRFTETLGSVSSSALRNKDQVAVFPYGGTRSRTTMHTS